jgi:large subunit ribosomal protein L9
MKVILRTDIEKLGTIGDLVTVKDGYARNYLVPQGHAYVADKGSLRRFEEEKKRLLSAADRERNRAEALKGRIEAQGYSIEVKTGEQGRLYGSVTAQNIADLLSEAGIQIDRRRIQLETPIKELGEHEVPVKLYGDIAAMARVTVIDSEAHVRAAIEAEIEAIEAAERAERDAARAAAQARAEAEDAPADE